MMKGSFMRRVLVPTDFSEAGLQVTQEALSWVDTMGGELLLLHVVPDIFLRWLDHLALAFIDQTKLESSYEDLREEGQRKFSAWLPGPARQCCRTLVLVGDRADAIIKVAQEELIDVIMMRAPKRRWRPILAGGVTDTVIRRAPVPVVVWAGLGRSSSGSGKGARRPHAQDAPRKGAWREPSRARWEDTPILKSC